MISRFMIAGIKQRTIGGTRDLGSRSVLIICRLNFDHYSEIFTEFAPDQNLGLVMKMLKGEKAHRAGLVYLQDEDYNFQTKDGGRIWSVYGSPVRSYCYLNWMYVL